MRYLSYVLPSLLRNPRRSAAYLVGTVMAVGLLASVLFFVVASAQVLTQHSIATVRVDMQAVPNDATSGVSALQTSLRAQPGVAAAQRFAIAGFADSQSQHGSNIGQTGAGKLIAVDPSYFNTFKSPVIRQGALTPGGVVISQDMGTNLAARVGDSVTVSFGHGIPSQRLTLTGVASMLHTDNLFLPLDPVLRANPFNPPANVIIMDYRRFERTVKPVLLRHSPPTPTGSVVLRYNSPVTEQVHLKLDRSLVPADPAQARIYTTELRHRLELAQVGRITIVDNLFAALDQAQADVLWAQVIFVFLTLPGVILSAALSRYVTNTVIDAQRRELALLRIRGIGQRQLLTLLGMALLLIAVLGVVLGLIAGWLTTAALGNGSAMSAGPLLWRTLGAAVVAGLILGAVSTFWPLMGFIRTPIVQARHRVSRGAAPLWSRLYLDVVALAIAALVYYITQRNGFQPALNAEGNPTISLSFFTFLAPLLFWVGAILLLVRISRGVVSRSGMLLDRLFPKAGVVGEVAARTLARRSGSLHQAVVLVAMAVAFSVGLATFVNTYNQQQRVDAELTLGSDVKVSVVTRSKSAMVGRRLNVPGVVSTTPFRSTVAYVGSEIQDIFGINVPSFVKATRQADTFYLRGSAAATLQRLQHTHDGVLISAETVKDFSLNFGDTVLLRMLDAKTYRYVPIRFHVVGAVREFATAPKDAFLVANLSYIESATHSRGVDAFLVKTSGSATAVADQLSQRFVHGPAVRVTDLNGVQQTLATSLTSLNLTSLSRIDYFYTLIMVLTALLVFTFAVLLDRAREFAMLEVLGATPNQIRRLILVEISYAAGVGTIFGLVVGLGFAQMLIQILTSIFDPPPDALAIPWSSLGLIAGLLVATSLAAWLVASIRLNRQNLAAILREA